MIKHLDFNFKFFSNCESFELVASKRKSFFSSENLVLIGSSFWWLNLYLYVPILPIYSKESGASLQFIGLIIASYAIGQMLFRIPVGYLADKLKSRKLFAVIAALTSCLGSSSLYFANSPMEIFVARSITGIAAAGWVAISVYYSSFFEKKFRSKSSTYILASNTTSVFAGLFLGGYISDIYGMKVCFLLSLLSGVIALIFFALSKEKKLSIEVKFSSKVFRNLLKNKLLISFCIIGIFTQFITFSTNFSFFPIYLNSLGYSDSIVGNIVSIGSLAGLIGTLVSPYLLNKFNFWNVAMMLSVPLAFTIFLTPYIESLFLLILVRLFSGFTWGTIFSSLMGLIVKEFDDNYQASAMGLFQAIYAIGMFSGPIVSGIIADWKGIYYVFLLSSITSLLILVVSFLMKSTKLKKY